MIHLHLGVDGGMVLFQALFARRTIAVAALPTLLFKSMSRERLLETVESKLVNSSITSRVTTPMVMFQTLLTSWSMMLVFLKLIVRPKSLHARVKELINLGRASTVWAVRTVSSAKSNSVLDEYLPHLVLRP